MRRLLALGLCALLAGCAQSPLWQSIQPLLYDAERPGQSAWDQHRARAEAVRAWTLLGRAAIQTEREGVSAAVRWVEQDGVYTLRLMGPFSQGSYELSGDAAGVVLRTPDGRDLQAEDPEALLQGALGWSLPVSGLRYWIRGIPAPGSEPSGLRLDALGRMTDVEQDGWRISVLRYTALQGLDLPEKLFMESRRLKLRIAVQSWELGLP